MHTSFRGWPRWRHSAFGEVMVFGPVPLPGCFTGFTAQASGFTLLWVHHAVFQPGDRPMDPKELNRILEFVSKVEDVQFRVHRAAVQDNFTVPRPNPQDCDVGSRPKADRQT